MVHMVYFCLLYIFFFKCIASSGARAIFYFRCNAFLVAHTIFYFRCNASLVAHPEKDELLMFGGEYFTGNKVIREHFLFCLYCTSDATLSLISSFCSIAQTQFSTSHVDSASQRQLFEVNLLSSQPLFS